MDMDKEFEEFQKTNQSSLIGFSVRNSFLSHDAEEASSSLTANNASGANSEFGSRAVSATRPVIKSNPSTSNVDYVSVDELKAEGGLLNDEDGEVLDTIMDDEGHLKEDALQVKEQLKKEVSEATKNVDTVALGVNEATLDDEHEKPTIFGGDAGQYVAPAAAMSHDISDFKYDSPSVKTPSIQTEEPELFKPQELTTVDDILEKINQGQDPEAIEDLEDKKLEDEISKKLNINIKDPEVPDSAIELDSELTAPASMREGSNSRLLQERQRSRSRNKGASPFREGTGTHKPHLARGDSYHSGLSNDDYNSTAPLDFGAVAAGTSTPSLIGDTGLNTSSSSSGEFERRPRHEPGVVRITNASSLKYLRSVSRSRSRVDTGRESSAVRTIDNPEASEEIELKNEGALMNDSDLSHMADLDDAISNALKIVEGTRSVNEGSKIAGDKESIVKSLQEAVGLDEVKEEEEPEDSEHVKLDVPKEIDAGKSEVGLEQPTDEAVKEDSTEGTKVEEETKRELEEGAEEKDDSTINLKKSEPDVEEPVVTKEVESAPSQKEEEEEDDIETLISNAQKEQAENSKPSPSGGVYVPKASKMTFEDEPVYIYTSLAGGFQIMTRTNRLETIMTANKIPVEFKDLGTDEEAKKVWRRYSGGKTLPGIVRGADDFIGNWEDIEEANENYEVRSLVYESY